MADIPPYPLYHHTYRLYRLSPLHHPAGPLLADRGLRQHAARLRDQLQGDHVRGVHVDVARAADDRRLSELLAGFKREAHTPPVPYPAACHPQGWDAAIPLALAHLLEHGQEQQPGKLENELA